MRKPDPGRVTSTPGSSILPSGHPTPEDAFVQVLASVVVDLSKVRDEEKLALDALVERLSQLSELATKASADMHTVPPKPSRAPLLRDGFLVI